MADAPSLQDDPSKISSDYEAMVGYWTMVGAILAGAEALRGMAHSSVPGPQVPYGNLWQLNRLAAGPQSPYLPQFPNETQKDYDIRRKNAPLTNIYADASADLASKPFAKELQLTEGAGEDLEKYSENIDGQGNNLHKFAGEVFKAGIDKGIHWIWVDYTRMAPGATLADERNVGARPYWVHVPAESLIAVYSKFINGQETVVHARMHEPCVEQDGYGEEVYERVRVFDRKPILNEASGFVVGYGPPTWVLYEKSTVGETNQPVWKEIDSGVITLGIIPLVPYMAGKRVGTSWRVDPPLRDLAFMQLEEFQQESGLWQAKTMTAFPMLCGEGVTGRDEKGVRLELDVGPKTTLFAPLDANGNHGTWKYVEPSGASLSFLEMSLEKFRTNMRDLGKQPLTAANLTVITTANVSLKANSACQAWALGLKDALEQAWKITCMWLNQKNEPEVVVYTDFAVQMGQGAEVPTLLQACNQGKLSDVTLREELKRRGILGDDFDEDQEQERLAEQQVGLEPEEQIDPRTGKPLNVNPLTGKPVPPENVTVQ